MGRYAKESIGKSINYGINDFQVHELPDSNPIQMLISNFVK
jgi:hypothetical protein